MNYILVQIIREGSLRKLFGGRIGHDAIACDQIFATKGCWAARYLLFDLRHVARSNVGAGSRLERRLPRSGNT